MGASIVINHVHIIFLAVTHLTDLTPSVSPTPIMEPVMV